MHGLLDDMSDDEAEYYAVQKHRYLIQKATNAFNDSKSKDSFDNTNDEEDGSSDDERDETILSVL